jgi:disulfide oxidoreductase YuzD
MEKNNTTAVEWLVEKLNIKYGNNDFIITHINEIEQAKQMEKEQIEDAYSMGSYDMELSEFRPDQYYNETYGKE